MECHMKWSERTKSERERRPRVTKRGKTKRENKKEESKERERDRESGRESREHSEMSIHMREVSFW